VRESKIIPRTVLLVVFGMFFCSAHVAAQDEQRLLVRDVRFEGNEYLNDLTLAASIATSESDFWARSWPVSWIGIGARRYLNETELRRDVLRILLLYRRSGFFESQVDTTVVRSGDAVRVAFHITEGEPVRVAAVGVEGTAEILAENDILPLLPLQVGDPSDRLMIQLAGDSILSLMRERAYPYAEIFRSFDEDRVARVSQIVYRVDPGPRVFVDSIVIIGAERIDEGIIRRMVRLEPGEPFSQTALRESQVDLYRLGLYDFVDVSLVDTLQPGEEVGVDVRVQVSEAPLQRVRAGVGGGTFDCLRSIASWSMGNFLGGARTLDVSARLSKIGTAQIPACERDAAGSGRDELNYSITTGLRFPYVFSPRTSLTFAVVGERRSEFNAYVRKSIGGNLSLTRQTGPNIPITLSYSLSSGSTLADAATFCAILNVCLPEDFNRLQQTRVQSTIGLRAVRDRSNSPINPTRGTSTTLEIRAATVSNPRVQFIEGILEFASYHGVGARGVLSWRVRAATTFSTDFTIVPIEERFFLGGANSVRGFRQNELGPLVYAARSELVTRPPGDQGSIFIEDSISSLRPDVSPLGGNRAYLANIEFRHPLPVFAGRLVGAVFVDAGQVFAPEAVQDFDLSDVRITPGIGIRLITPLGPLRLDLAYNRYDAVSAPLFIEREPDLILFPRSFQTNPDLVTRLRWNFSVGQPF